MGFEGSSDKPCATPCSSNISSIASTRPLFQTSSNQRRTSALFSSDMRSLQSGRYGRVNLITKFADGSSSSTLLLRVSGEIVSRANSGLLPNDDQVVSTQYLTASSISLKNRLHSRFVHLQDQIPVTFIIKLNSKDKDFAIQVEKSHGNAVLSWLTVLPPHL